MREKKGQKECVKRARMKEMKRKIDQVRRGMVVGPLWGQMF